MNDNPNHIKALLLDLGGVVVEIDWNRTFQVLLPETTDPQKIIEQIGNSDSFHQFEKGAISPQQFHKSMENHFDRQSDYQTFANAWNSCLVGPFPGIENLLNLVKVPIYALTNTNQLHFDYFCQWTFSMIKKVYPSHHLHQRKPDIIFYELALQDIGIPPNQVLFIDDMTPNLKAAQKIGLHAEKSVSSIRTLKNILLHYKLI